MEKPAKSRKEAVKHNKNFRFAFEKQKLTKKTKEKY